MIKFIAILEILIFIFLSAIHFYWAFGGKWGINAVFPTKNENEKIILPGIIPTLIVAFGLLGFGFIVYANVFYFKSIYPNWINYIIKYGLWIIVVIFFIRAVGEFRYVGFFKKIKNTKFAVNDTKYYSPLCLLIGILGLIIILNK